MSEIEIETTDMRAFVEKLGALIEYSAALKSGAHAVAYTMPAEWQGPAMTQFFATFEAWTASAAVLEEISTQLKEHASTVLEHYEAAIEGGDEVWTSVNDQLSTVGV